jgi:hypothetical protein
LLIKPQVTVAVAVSESVTVSIAVAVSVAIPVALTLEVLKGVGNYYQCYQMVPLPANAI